MPQAACVSQCWILSPSGFKGEVSKRREVTGTVENCHDLLGSHSRIRLPSVGLLKYARCFRLLLHDAHGVE